MKKIFTFAIAAFALVFATSCEKDNQNDDNNTTTDPLTGTEWQTSQTVSYEDMIDLDMVVELDFNANNVFEMSMDVDLGALGDIPGMDEYLDLDLEDVEGTWEYDKPNVYMTAEGETIVAVLDGNTLTISGQGSEDIFDGDLVFTKK